MKSQLAEFAADFNLLFRASEFNLQPVLRGNPGEYNGLELLLEMRYEVLVLFVPGGWVAFQAALEIAQLSKHQFALRDLGTVIFRLGPRVCQQKLALECYSWLVFPAGQAFQLGQDGRAIQRAVSHNQLPEMRGKGRYASSGRSLDLH